MDAPGGAHSQEDGAPSPSRSAGRRAQWMAQGTSELGQQRRRESARALGRDRRDAAVRAKRIRRSFAEGGEQGEGEGGMHVEAGDAPSPLQPVPSPAELDQSAQSAVAALRTALSLTGAAAAQAQVQALGALRRVLSCCEEPPLSAAVAAGAVPLLCQSLGFGASEDQLLEAAWCVTNLASGDAAVTSAALPAAPLLVAHCGGGVAPAPVAEQCAWALGNFAAESAELRLALLDQGALPALGRMLASCAPGTGTGSSPRSAGFCRTTAWAVSSLIKGPNPRAVAELLKLPGVARAVVHLLSRTEDPETAAEAAWVAVYACALSEASASILGQHGLAAPLAALLRTVPVSDAVALTPVVRAIGNFCGGDSVRIDQLLGLHTGPTGAAGPTGPGGAAEGPASQVGGAAQVLDGLVACLGAPHRSLQKDGAWALANISAGAPGHRDAVWEHPKAVAQLTLTLRNAPFDIRLEAAYAVANLCTRPAQLGPAQPGPAGAPRQDGDPDRLQRLLALGCLRPFLDLIRAPDAQAALLGLQFTELVLRLLPDGPSAVEQVDGIDALESLQFNDNEQLSKMSSALVDTYFGEDYGL